MSHRRVKDIAYDEDAFDDEDDYDYAEDGGGGDAEKLTSEDEEQLQAGAVAVRAELDEAGDAITDKEIRDALWYYYFDVGKSVDYLRRQHAPPETKQTPKKSDKKPLSKFDQAAAAAKEKLAVGALRLPASKARSRFGEQCANYFTAAEFFADTPFLGVPSTRLGNFVPAMQRSHLRGGLLGGSSTGKPSKLAALAASRKRAAEEKKKGTSASEPAAGTGTSEDPQKGEKSDSIALMDKLGKSKSQKTSEESYPGSKVGINRANTGDEPTKRRAYPTREKPPEVQPEPEPPALEDQNHQEVEVEPEDNADDLIAPPSAFAVCLFGGRNISHAKNHDYDEMREERIHSRTQMFTLPYPAAVDDGNSRSGKVTTNSDPFAGPSPDDVVSQAQAKGAKKNIKTNATKSAAGTTKHQKPSATTSAQDFAALKIADTPAPSSKVKSRNMDVLAEYEKSNLKNSASFVVIGHVDHGKSTLMGRLLYDLSLIPARKFQKLQASAQQAGKSSFPYAWLLDTNESERTHGITFDIASTCFSTENTNFTILDAPGHKDFVKNMIAGTSQADFAVLVVDAGTDAFETGLEGGGQTKEHALLARALGITKMVVAVNKMDSAMPPWSKERFDIVSQQLGAFLASAGFAAKNVAYVPCAGLVGQNVVNTLPKASKETGDDSTPWSWYTGPTLLSQLDTTASATTATSTEQIAAPLRLTVFDIYPASVTSPLSITGRIDSGSLQVGDVVLSMPSSEKATIKGVEVFNTSLSSSSTPSPPATPTSTLQNGDINTITQEDTEMQGDSQTNTTQQDGWAVAGQIASVHLAEIDPVHLRNGDVLCSVIQPIHNARSFITKILAFDFMLPGPIDCHRGRMHAEAKVVQLIAAIDKNEGAEAESSGGDEKKKKKKLMVIRPGMVATIKVGLVRALPLEAGARIVLRYQGTTVAAGLVESVEVA